MRTYLIWAIMITMGVAIVTNSNKYSTASQLRATDPIGREQVQRLDNDWSDVPVDYFTYSSASRITIAGFVPSSYFQVGDILWIKQNSSEKYFYVFDVGDTYLDIDGGSDYTFTSDALQFIKFSRMGNPSGFPGRIRYTPELGQEGDTPTLLPDSTFLYYKMSGNQVIISGNVVWTEAAGTDSAIYISLPFTLRTGKSTWFTISILPLIYSPVADLVQVSVGENGVGGLLTMYVWNEGTLIPAGGNELYLQLIYYQ